MHVTGKLMGRDGQEYSPPHWWRCAGFFFFFFCLKPHSGWKGRILTPQNRLILFGVFKLQSNFCCFSSISWNLYFCERKTTFPFSFIPLRCSCCHLLTVTKSFLYFSHLEKLKIPTELLPGDLQPHAGACAQLGSATDSLLRISARWTSKSR